MEEIDGSVVRDVWMRCVMWQMWQVMRMPSSQDVQMRCVVMLSQDARMRGVELRWLLSQASQDFIRTTRIPRPVQNSFQRPSTMGLIVDPLPVR